MFARRTAIAATASIAAAVATPAAAAPILGDAADFNIFAIGRLDATNANIGGRVFAGDDAFLRNLNIGSGLANSHGARDDLITGGALDFVNGQVLSGNIRYASAGSHLNNLGMHGGSAYLAPLPISLPTAAAQLRDASAHWSTFAATGSTAMQWGGLTLVGDNSDFNVFTVSGDDLWSAHSLAIDVPTGATALINITGQLGRMQNLGLTLRGAASDKILFNFFEAEALSFTGVNVRGAILAPDADVSFRNAQLTGMLIADNINAAGAFTNATFNGYLPPVPAPAAATLLGAGILTITRRRR